MGIPLAVTAILGIILALFRRKDVLFALILMLLVFVLYFGSAMEDRYYILVMPVLALFAGSFLSFLIDLGSLPVKGLSPSSAEFPRRRASST